MRRLLPNGVNALAPRRTHRSGNFSNPQLPQHLFLVGRFPHRRRLRERRLIFIENISRNRANWASSIGIVITGSGTSLPPNQHDERLGPAREVCEPCARAD